MACFTMGEAAGTACALSLAAGYTVRELDVKALQRELLANGVNLGQSFRPIPGVTDGTNALRDDYKNPEFKEEKFVVRDAGNEFNLQNKSR